MNYEKHFSLSFYLSLSCFLCLVIYDLMLLMLLLIMKMMMMMMLMVVKQEVGGVGVHEEC